MQKISCARQSANKNTKDTYARPDPILAHNISDNNILRHAVHHTLCAHRYGQAAHTAHSGHGAGGGDSGASRIRHPGQRQVDGDIRARGAVLHNAACRAGDEHGRLPQEPRPDVHPRHNGLHSAHGHGLRHQQVGAQLWLHHLGAAGQHVRLAHADSLPYGAALRPVWAAQRDYCRGGRRPSPTR